MDYLYHFFHTVSQSTLFYSSVYAMQVLQKEMTMESERAGLASNEDVMALVSLPPLWQPRRFPPGQGRSTPYGNRFFL